MEQKRDDRKRRGLIKTHDRSGKKVEDKTEGFAAWVRESVQKLIQHGHTLDEIGNYPLDRFVTFLSTIQRIEAEERAVYITDMALVVAGVLGGGDDLTKHLDDLKDVD